MNIEIKRYNIIQLVMLVADEQLLDKVGSELRQSISVKKEHVSENTSLVEDPIVKYSTVIEQEFDLEKIKKEQNYTGIDAKKMYRLIEEADIQEPIEDLLKMI